MDIRAAHSSPWSRLRRYWTVLACAVAAMMPAAALADLMLFPTRVIFDRNTRAAQVELINNGQQPATYRIVLVNRRMNETGEFGPADPPLPDERFATNLVRYSPRQVVLPPGGTQTVRLLLRKPAELPAGEYRSHLQFDLVPEASGASSIDARPAAEPEGELGVQLRPLIGVSIPVIVRHGDTSAQVRVTALRLESSANDGVPVVSAIIERSGNRSAYGDLVATFTDGTGVARELGRAAGVAVYTPNPLRRVRMTLPPSAAALLRGGTLRLAYVQRPEEGGRSMAQASVQVP